MKEKVLMIVTSHGHLGDTGRRTGLYLSELAHPYEVFEQAGLEVSVASPLGGEAPIDPKSLSDELARFVDLTKETLPLNKIEPKEYKAFFIVGGHGSVWDLPNDAELQRIFSQAHAQGKVISSVCHGSAALVNLKDASGRFLIQGKKITGFTNSEEAAVNLTEIVPFLLEDELKQSGGKFIGKPNWQENVEIDGQLVTGQNPASARSVAEAVVKLLQLQPVAV
jgi:putative intracellular protease/amidase